MIFGGVRVFESELATTRIAVKRSKNRRLQRNLLNNMVINTFLVAFKLQWEYSCILNL